MELFHRFLGGGRFLPSSLAFLESDAYAKLHPILDLLIAALFFFVFFTVTHFIRQRRREAGRTEKPDVARATNEALTEQTRLLNLIVGNMGDGLLVVDQNGRSLLSNAATKRMLGLHPYQDLPENCGETCGFYRPDKVTRLSAAESPTGRAMRGELVDGEEIFVHRLNHEPGMWSNVTARPLRDENGVIHGAVAVFRDISAQKQAEVERENLLKERAARIEAEAANKAKDRFLAMLGHELRTPLTPVLASVELLEQELGPGSEAQSAVTVIRRNVELEARLIDDILDLSAIRKGKIGLHVETVDLHTVLRNTVSIFQPEIDRKHIETDLDLTAESHFVCADPSRLMQVFWNLIKNAIKFTSAGGKLIFSSRNEGERIVIDVCDNGLGIAPELLSRVFESFEQGTRQVEAGYGGLGLGLTIAKAIADAHGSELSVRSRGREQGATFTLAMKTVMPTAKEQHLPETVREHVNESTGNGTTHDPMSILLVDDHKDTVRTLDRLLTRLGYSVTSAESVGEALKAASEHHFDLLVSDIGLPDGSGLDLMRQIRETQPMNGIALSGFGMEDDLRKSREAGFVDHLIKPINLDRLQAAIRRFEHQVV